nr:HlyD family efflux transporter periplasmic adaptor subunit [uncultured Desulfobacter sp.]
MRLWKIRTPIISSLILILTAVSIHAASNRLAHGIIQITQINLRETLDGTGRILAVLEKGMKVDIIERRDGWLQIKYKDLTGYLKDSKKYIKVIDDAAVSDGPLTSMTQSSQELNTPTPPAAASSEQSMSMMAAGGKEFVGVIYPMHDISLSMGVDGLVSSVKVKLGDTVDSRQQLLQLDDEAQRIETHRRKVIYQNRAELDSIKKRIARIKKFMDDSRLLFEENGSVSEEEVIRAELEYYTLKGRYDQLQGEKSREKLEYTAAKQQADMRSLYAPIKGVITMLDIDKGEWVRAGQNLIELVDTSSGILRLAIPESTAVLLKKGMRVPMRFEAHPDTGQASGRITFVSAVADPASGLVKVEITFNNNALGIRPGGKGYARLPNVRLAQ